MTDAERALADAKATENPHTDVLSEQTFLDQDVEQPGWAPGPFRVDPELTFELDAQWRDPAGVGWSSESLINPSVIEVGGFLHVFYRASPRKESLSSRIGHAVLTDEGWRDDAANPVVWPTLPGEELGVEDPKVYRRPEGFALFYNAVFATTEAQRSRHPSPGYPVGDIGCDMSVATSTDLVTWTKHGPITRHEESRLWAKGAVIPRAADGSAVAIDGQYLMYVSEGFDGVLHVGRSTDLVSWEFEPIDYLGDIGGHLHEIATATVIDDRIVLDYFLSDESGWAAARTEYAVSDPFTPVRRAPGGTLAWGGLIRWRDRWLFSQGWDAAPGRRQLLFYRSEH
ncbi:hypothetical protein QT381_10960 [Galbitalea sp. SE-J8]|uniref:glycoside hydrolase family 130 protein n=1 Tax=Galbitalea sp. SE-J8 TaxID=3054952 RepID=UPI00259D0745|nr:hypothetical protein [Galbitalea sp. SE-J8]MDM4763529.1 hypothetical protein [Galbitalea sp. SE-J8]